MNSSSSSDASHNMQEDGFRVSVCLQRYFSDERCRAYVCVQRRRPVRWLQQRLRALFGLQDSFCLCSRGHLLPPDEPLTVLKPDDPVEVIPLSERSLEWNRHGFVYNIEESSHDIESNLPEKKFTETQAVHLTQNAEKDELLRVKEKALAQLDLLECIASNAELNTGPAASDTGSSDKLRRTRRRVRRRKRPLSGMESNGGNTQKEDSINTDKAMIPNVYMTSKQICSKLPTTELQSLRVEMARIETEESKNASEKDISAGPRRARLVRSLSLAYGHSPCTNVL